MLELVHPKFEHLECINEVKKILKFSEKKIDIFFC